MATTALPVSDLAPERTGSSRRWGRFLKFAPEEFTAQPPFQGVEQEGYDRAGHMRDLCTNQRHRIRQAVRERLGRAVFNAGFHVVHVAAHVADVEFYLHWRMGQPFETKREGGSRRTCRRTLVERQGTSVPLCAECVERRGEARRKEVGNLVGKQGRGHGGGSGRPYRTEIDWTQYTVEYALRNSQMVILCVMLRCYFSGLEENWRIKPRRIGVRRGW